ncbi:WW domain-containing protein wwm1 [Emydomyces testavorans]|uniref:WW domain-containing protein wwm1 n=1 Tax=Emydomyces testavorans TaxID=2070801 RepID=A0AAF0IH03_9EURO|nr:WW domain-containing protein wwm1 [Emydomyces testavorans]
MSFAPPPGPPTPRVPEGWKAQYHDGYKEWYYVDLSTGVSQWNPPPMPAQAPGQRPVSSSSPPPMYEASGPGNVEAVAAASGTEQKIRPESGHSPLSSNNPYKSPNNENSSTKPLSTPAPSDKKDPIKVPNTMDDDARLAAQLQEEENERARRQGYDSVLEANNTNPPAPNAPYPSANYAPVSPPPSSSGQQQQQTRGKGGFLGKLFNKGKHSQGASGGQPQQAGFYPPSPQPQAQYGYTGGYPPQGPGGYYGPQYPPQQYAYGAQPGMQPGRQGGRGGGMGMAGAAALGVGGGLLGGALLANALDDHHDYQEGYQEGFADGDDYGGDDFGGGDFGGFD